MNYIDVQNGGNTITGVGNLSTFYQDQTLVIWQPQPAPGYVCLGVVVTNTSAQPQTASDAGGPYAMQEQTLAPDASGVLVQTQNLDYPVYCIQQQYAAPGQLVPVATNGSVDFYKVVAKDSTGYGDANLFWAFPSDTPEATRQAQKVYVPALKYTRILPDL